MRKKKSVPICYSCTRKAIKKDNSFVFLQAGALLLEDADNGSSHEKMETYFDIGFHGGTFRPDFIVHMAVDQARGQFEIYFCSAKCLRKFFDKAVDKLEKNIIQPKRVKNKKKDLSRQRGRAN